MTAPTVDATDTQGEPDGPIPDDLLRDAILGRANANPIADLLGDTAEPAADTPPSNPDASAPTADQPPAPDVPATNAGPDADPNAPKADQPEGDEWSRLAKDAVPLTYRMNGQAQTFPGILEVSGKGALIPADRLDEVRNLVARYESNAAATKELYADRQRYEQLGGYDGILKKLETAEQTNAAALAILETAQKNPALLTDPQAFQSVVREATLAAREAVWQFRTEREKQVQQHAATESESAVLESAIPNALSAFRERYPTLTDADMQAAEKVFGPIRQSLVYTATPEDAQKYGYRVGQKLVNMDAMHPWFVERAEWRATQTTDKAKADAAAKAATQAAAENARRNPAPKAAPKRTPPRNDAGQFVEREERLDSATMFERAMAGRSVRTGGARDED